jgi:uncharacterized protein (TIGR02646 family)
MLECDDWKPTWDNFQNPQKNEVLDALLSEQGYICGYCGQRIERDSSHIEHVIPRCKDASKSLDYENFIGSCQPDRFHPTQESHCGHNKSSWHEPSLFVSPLVEGCEGRFVYTAAGEMHPKDKHDIAADTTIKKLALDIDFLNTSRRNIIEAFIDLPEEDLKKIIDDFSAFRPDGKLDPFCFVVTTFFSGYTNY